MIAAESAIEKEEDFNLDHALVIYLLGKQEMLASSPGPGQNISLKMLMIKLI